MQHKSYSILFVLWTVLCMTLFLTTGCMLKRSATVHQPDSFTLRFNDEGKFKIAQFTDIHWENDSLEKCADASRLIRHVLKEERPDLAVLTGDIVIQPSEEGWKAVTALFTEAGIPFAVVMGNHDDESEWSRDRIFDFLETIGGFVGSKGPESISGVGNYIIGIRSAASNTAKSSTSASSGAAATSLSSDTSGTAGTSLSPSSSSSSTSSTLATAIASSASASSSSASNDSSDLSVTSGKAASAISPASPGSTAALLYFLDSNSYGGDEKISTYGWIKFDQIAWYREQSLKMTILNSGNPYPALAFFHIPLPEYKEIPGKEQTMGIKKEEECSPKINTGMLAAFVEMKDVMGVFVGHDHDNNYIGIHKGIALAYGQKTGFSSYGSIGRGSRIIEFREGERSFNTWIRTLEGTAYHYNYPSGKSFR